MGLLEEDATAQIAAVAKRLSQEKAELAQARAEAAEAAAKPASKSRSKQGG